MSRWKAASIHLLISAVVGLISATLIFGVWYPPPYSSAMGAGELVVLLLGVNIVLGPLLTLVVFKSGKKYLRLDLAIIALAQACALVYGISVVVGARPVFIVGQIDRFVVVAANNLDPADLAKGSQPEFRSLPWTGPRLVGAQLPTDPKEAADLMYSSIAGKDIEKYPKYYVDYNRVSEALIKRAKPLNELYKKHPEAAKAVDAWLRKHQRDSAGVVWLPMIARRSDMTMLLDPATRQPLDALPIDSW